MIKYIFIFILTITAGTIVAQNDDSYQQIKKQWFVTLAGGIQMSGIKDEDFVSRNIAPAFSFGTGLWFTPEIALQLGYKGFYFKTIADNDKHHYNYYFGEVFLNINSLTKSSKTRKSNWTLIIHPGAGLFYNVYYNRPNICAHIGVINNFNLTKNVGVFADISFILGWDIYQGNDDILPRCVLGLNYIFN